jgi:hypothetical protein
MLELQLFFDNEKGSGIVCKVSLAGLNNSLVSDI